MREKQALSYMISMPIRGRKRFRCALFNETKSRLDFNLFP